MADADDGSFVVFELDVSFHLILRGCLSPSGLDDDDTLLESSQSAAAWPWPPFLRDLDDITNSPVLISHTTAELGRAAVFVY